MKLIPLEDILNTFSEEDRTKIETNAQKMISEYALEQLYNALIEYEQGWQDATATKSPIPKPPKASLEISLSALKTYIETMGGKLSLHIDFPTGKHLGFNI